MPRNPVFSPLSLLAGNREEKKNTKHISSLKYLVIPKYWRFWSHLWSLLKMGDHSSECRKSHRNGFLHTVYQISYEHVVKSLILYSHTIPWQSYVSNKDKTTNLGPLHVCEGCVAWSICETPGNGSRSWLLGTYSSYLSVLPSLNTGGGSWSCDSLICNAFLMPVGSRPLSQQIRRRDGLRGIEWGSGRKEGRECCSQEVK